ncbi:MAG: pyridoxal 4-dehydrogenase [Alphaproteobacteria bacterium]|nr:MAG: pyridoxal 4-dehydrogenase [Alphaproteobacteria bacterium]
MGCAMLGNLYAPVSDAEADSALRAASTGGVHYYDTAPFYGHGLSEARLGRFLASMETRPLLSTKVGRSLAHGEMPGETGFVDAARARPYFDYSAGAVSRQVAESLGRLAVDNVDMLLVHDLGAFTHGSAHERQFDTAMAGAFPALAGLQRQGITRAIGLGVNEVAICLQVLAQIDIDVILLAGRYTLLEQAPLDDLLPLCEARGVQVIVGGPFNSGVLAGSPHYDYGAVPPAVAARVQALSAICARHDVPLAAAALQFPLAHPAVCSVIPGSSSAAEIRANITLVARPIPAALWADLKQAGLLRADAPVPA